VNGATTNFLEEGLEKGAEIRATIDSV